MKRKNDKQAYSLIEILLAVSMTVVLMLVVYNFYNTARVVYSSGVTGQVLQDGVNIVLSKIIEGKTEPAGIYRLAEAVSYSIVNMSELHFWGSDSIERWYKLNGTSTALIYHHPTSAGTQDETIYTAPQGATLTLRFWVPAVANYTAAVVGVDASLTQVVSGKTVSGSSTTVINLRNHP